MTNLTHVRKHRRKSRAPGIPADVLRYIEPENKKFVVATSVGPRGRAEIEHNPIGGYDLWQVYLIGKGIETKNADGSVSPYEAYEYDTYKEAAEAADRLVGKKK